MYGGQVSAHAVLKNVLSLTNIAQEITTGFAGVTVSNEADLAYCEVKPLLRLPERLLQFEHMQARLKAGVANDA